MLHTSKFVNSHNKDTKKIEVNLPGDKTIFTVTMFKDFKNIIFIK